MADRVYAEALLEAARDQEKVDEVREELGEFVAAVGASDELRSLLRNPQIEPHVKRDALAAALGDAEPLVRNFLLLLAEKGRIAEVDEIQGELERLIALQERVLELELTTAVELSDKEAAKRRRPDRAGLRPQGRGHQERRPRPDRGHRHPGRLAAPRRERARTAGPATPGTDSKELRIT